MRVVCEIPHPQLKITVFNYNDKYQIQIEAGPFRQMYAIPNDKVKSVDHLKTLIDEEFLKGSDEIIDLMYKNFKETITRNL